MGIVPGAKAHRGHQGSMTLPLNTDSGPWCGDVHLHRSPYHMLPLEEGRITHDPLAS